MDVIKHFFRELFKTIFEAIWGYAIGIFAFTLVMIALSEMFKIFIELGFLQLVAISSGIILVLGIIDYGGDWEIFVTISEFIEDLFKSLSDFLEGKRD